MPAFDVELPLSTESTSTSDHSDVFVARQRARVLVVDDELLILRSVKRTLTGHDVTTVCGAREALQILGAGDFFDVILCDLMMPDMDGIQFYDSVQAARPEMLERIVFMTGGAYSTEGRNFMAKQRAHRQLEKPFNTDAIRECVECMLTHSLNSR